MSELEDIEDAMRSHPDPVVTVPELTELLDRSDTAIRQDLKLLERAGAVGSKDTGAHSTAWWHEDRVTRRHVDPGDHPDQSDLKGSVERSETDTTRSADETEPAAGTGTVDDAVDLLDPAGRTPDVYQDRVEAMRSLLMHLRDGGPASGGDLQETIQQHHETHYKSADSFWKNLGQPSLKELREHGFVDYDDDGSVWQWVGGEQ